MAVLVRFEKNWADEFDVHGFKIYDSEEDFLSRIGDINELEYWFGTNEGWEVGEFEMDDFTVISLPAQELEYIKSVFGAKYGHFPIY